MRWRIVLWTSLSLLTLTLMLVEPSLWRQASSLTQDFLTQKLASDTPIDDVILIDIDETSLELIGSWPWSRAHIASLIDTLSDYYHTRIIGLDIIFPEPKNNQEDNLLVQSVHNTNSIIALVWDYQGQTPPLAIGETGDGVFIQGSAPNAKGYLGNFASLAATGKTGHISPTPDSNGKIRYIFPIVNWKNQSYPMLALAMLAQIKQKALHPVIYNHCLYPFAGEKLSLCTDKEGLWSIPYRQNLSSFTVIPAWQILVKELPEHFLEHKSIIIGSSALGLSDRVVTPLAAVTPGMSVHAQILTHLLNDNETREVAGPNVILFLIISSFLLSLILMRWGIRYGLIFVLLSSILWLYWVSTDYLKGYSLPDIALPIFVLLLWLASQSALEWSLIKRQSQRIYRLFQDYLPPHLLKQALAQPNETMLQPQQRYVTVLFADIAGFTTMTEQMPTLEAVALTRNILSLLTQAVYTHDGTLDKYMGDALMAFWNAPLDQTNHTQQAIHAALMMRDYMHTLNKERVIVGLEPIHVRIGINSGEVLVGDLGTQWRHAYTVLGDAVNVAQRLMVAAGQLGVDIALGKTTATGNAQCELIGEMHLPGRERLERVFVIPITMIAQ